MGHGQPAYFGHWTALSGSMKPAPQPSRQAPALMLCGGCARSERMGASAAAASGSPAALFGQRVLRRASTIGPDIPEGSSISGWQK
jgi:hypothetical protein